MTNRRASREARRQREAEERAQQELAVRTEFERQASSFNEGEQAAITADQERLATSQIDEQTDDFGLGQSEPGIDPFGTDFKKRLRR